MFKRNIISFKFTNKLQYLKKSSYFNFRNSSSKTNPLNLPRLPVPPLKDTLSRFLKSAQPFVTEEEFKNTELKCKEFETGEGAKLQKLLQARADEKDNWMEEYWVKYGYLENRNSVVVHSSPGFIFPRFDINDLSDGLRYTSKIITIALEFKKKIDDNAVPQEKMGNVLLDMGQYKKIFGTYRVPGMKIDTLEYYPDSKHIIFMYKNNMFKITLYKENNTVLNSNEIRFQLEQCIKLIDKDIVQVGILTSDRRDNWGKAYQILVEDSQNLKYINDIKSSLFVIALDSVMPNQNSSFNLSTASHQCVHGGGAQGNSGNRWFDKTIQFIIGSTGIIGMNYEHSPAEGVPIAMMADEILNTLKTKSNNPDYLVDVNLPPIEKLNFNITSELSNCIDTAKKNITILANDFYSEVVHFRDYGKQFIKRSKLSPDSYIQMAIQYTFYRMHKKPGAQYESGHTRQFIHGRTETIRSCSTESTEFSSAMIGHFTDSERVNLMRAAINSHKEYSSLALQGLGVDRHFFALKILAMENNIPIPEFFNDPGYTRSSHMQIATSQVPSKYDAFMSYGPIVKDGYAVCYNPRENDIFLACASFRSSKENNLLTFVSTLKECLVDMKNTLSRALV